MSGEREDERSRGATWVADTGGVIAAWVLLVAVENIAVAFACRDQLAGSWELAHARYYLSPIALAGMAPLAIPVVFAGRLVAARRAGVLAVLVGAAAIGVAVGVSEGRHMSSLALRIPFVLAVGLAAGQLTSSGVKHAPLDRPGTLAAIGAGVAALAWTTDLLVLPHLYPAFHAALFAVTLAGSAATSLLRRERRGWPWGALFVVAAAAACAWAPRAAHAVVGDDNLRRILVEHAPVLGRAVVAASQIAPPAPLDDDASMTPTTAAALRPLSKTRALDWTGHDIVLVTIDALRADHVSSYGYARATTPNIDRLAARGARFEHAYCPTPHTSYSVTSMMTGKYMRPLLSMGAGDDSQTWAGYLRDYGFRTAAFYPPAVFFIDEHRFRRMKAEGLGFEYRKEEFATPALRRSQIEDYVGAAPKDKPLFLWVHLFEPHEPYVRHPEHVFAGDESVDAYDSEVATADGVVGEIVAVLEKRRAGAVFIVSADHGEEFGDHGGRYHGTTVYEEQVRVPLVVVGPGVPPHVVTMPVQTIDLLPTTLAALDVPQPARLRGRDLGAALANDALARDQGLAFAETDDYTLVARDNDRLVCLRKIASCTLFDVATDPHEQKPVGDRPARVQELRRLAAAIERENGKLETSALPEALRRGLQGDREAAEDIAPLFDDARVVIRREAARCAFRLRAPSISPQLRRALARDEDEQVRRWSALALVRLGARAESDGGAANAAAGAVDPAAESLATALLADASPTFRVAAALAAAEHGDARGEGELASRWEEAFVPNARAPGELEEAREVLAALAKIRARAAAPLLARSLEDVRLRPFVAEALGEIGDPRAAPALLAALAAERHVDAWPKEARALLRLGARGALLQPLRGFAGGSEPMLEALDLAREAGLLVAGEGGWTTDTRPLHADVSVSVPPGGRTAGRLMVAAGEQPLTGKVDGEPIRAERRGPVWIAELTAVGPSARVELDHPAGVSAFWLVRRTGEGGL